MKKIWILLLYLVSFITPVYTQISITSGTFHDEISIFFLNDLNLSGVAESPRLFYIDIVNSYLEEKNLILNFKMIYEGDFMEDIELVSGQTLPFSISPGLLRITNQNLFSETDPYRLSSYDLNNEATDKLINQLLASGKLPTGDYRFLLSVNDMDGVTVQIDQTELLYNITNSGSIDLISPGYPVDEGDIRHIYTTLPFFRWESDAQNFTIRICEKLETNASPEDVMNNEPRLEMDVQNSFLQYPATGAYLLEEGKTYYWQVWALVNTSSGLVDIASEIWGFKILNLTSGSNVFEQSHIMNVLRTILGDEVVDELFKDGGELCNHSFSGIVLHNGEVITIDKLLEISKEFSSGKYNVKSFFIE